MTLGQAMVSINTPKAQVTTIKKNKINWDYIQSKISCSANDNKKVKQHTEWEKIFANPVSDTGLVFETCK